MNSNSLITNWHIYYSIWPFLLAIGLNAFFAWHCWQGIRLRVWRRIGVAPLERLYLGVIALIMVQSTVGLIHVLFAGSTDNLWAYYRDATLLVCFGMLALATALVWEWHKAVYSPVVISAHLVAVIGVSALVHAEHLDGFWITHALAAAVSLILIYGWVQHERIVRRRRCVLLSLSWMPLTSSLIWLPADVWPMVLAVTGMLVSGSIYAGQFRLRKIGGITLPANALKLPTAHSADVAPLSDIVDRIEKKIGYPVSIISFHESIYPKPPYANPPLDLPLALLENFRSAITLDDAAELSSSLYREMAAQEIALFLPMMQDDKPVAWCLLKMAPGVSLGRRESKSMFMELASAFAAAYEDQRKKYQEQEHELFRLMAKETELSDATVRLQEDISQGLRPQMLFYSDRLIADAVDHVKSSLSKYDAQLIYLGRDREIIWELRKAFPGIRYFVGPNSKFSATTASGLIYDAARFNLRDERILMHWLERQEKSITLFIASNQLAAIQRALSKYPLRAAANVVALSSREPEKMIAEINAAGFAHLENEVERFSLIAATDAFEYKLLRRAMELCHENKMQAAQILGLKPYTLKRKLDEYLNEEEERVKLVGTSAP